MKKRFLLSALSLGALSLGGCSSSDASLAPYQKSLPFHDGFSLLWLTDLHWGKKGTGIDYALETTHFKAMIADATQEKKPDLLVFTGDVFQDETEAEIDDFFALVEETGIPWAFTFGNHDQKPFLKDPDFLSKKIESYPNAVYADVSGDTLTGKANYFINLLENGQTKYRLYLIDSNSYKDPSDASSGYDIIHPEQLEHLKKIVAKEGAAPGLAFFHIPLKEYSDAYYRYISKQDQGQGKNGEDPCPGYENNGAYTLFKSLGIKGCFCGHDHKNDSDIFYKSEMILSYGLKGSDLDYHDAAMIGYKVIRLPKKASDFSLASIESHFVLY
jgi:predicted MPP superfamily phosphohydrolase